MSALRLRPPRHAWPLPRVRHRASEGAGGSDRVNEAPPPSLDTLAKVAAGVKAKDPLR